MAKTASNSQILDRFFDLETLIEIPSEDQTPELQTICPLVDLAFNFFDQSFYYYFNGLWSILSDSNPKTGLTVRCIESFLNTHFPDYPVTTAKLNEIKESLMRNCKNRFVTKTPSPYVVFEDQSLNVSSFDFAPHDPKHRAIFSLPFPADQLNMPTPVFDKYINDSFSEQEERDYILDMLGYYLIPYDLEPASFYLYGLPRTGKTRLLNLLFNIFTPKFYCSFSLQSLTTDQHTVAELSGKLINILDEDESDRIRSDKFKTLIDHGSVQARRLYQSSFNFNPYAKYLIASNQLPNVKYADGLDRRLHFAHFKNVVPIDKQDKHLDEKLKAEIPGIIGKALNHAKQFVERNGEFVIPMSSKLVKNEFIQMVLPSTLFLEERCVVLNPDSVSSSWATNAEIYSEYKSWCSDSGHRPLSSQNLHRQLTTYSKLSTKVVDGERKKNIKLKGIQNGIFGKTN